MPQVLIEDAYQKVSADETITAAWFTVRVTDADTDADYARKYDCTAEDLALGVPAVIEREIDKAIAEFNRITRPDRIVPIDISAVDLADKSKSVLTPVSTVVDAVPPSL